MKEKELKNIPASIRTRLKSASIQNREDFNYTITRYASERFLYRLSISPHRDSFILKGASLFRVWDNIPYRATRDIDLLGCTSSDVQSIETVFKEVCTCEITRCPDGIIFLPETVRGEEIRENADYGGIRITFKASLDRMPIHLQVDIGFGDIVTPGPEEVTYPTFLPDLPPPILKTYNKETVVAEKLEAIIKLGKFNSRMKDFYDLCRMSGTLVFSGDTVIMAIKHTFRRRGTPLPEEPPIALTSAFFNDSEKKKLWNAFIKRGQTVDNPENLETAIDQIRKFLLPPLEALNQNMEFRKIWKNNTWE